MTDDDRLKSLIHSPGNGELLIEHAYQRLRRLTGKILSAYPGVRRWEETDDVLQNASLRLWRSLGDVKPENVAGFFGLAAMQIRRELIDLARRHYGRDGLGANLASNDTDGST